MPTLRIFADPPLDHSALRLLREGVQPHELLLPATPTASVLVKAESDPAFATADIAFGQPEVADVLASPRLRWLHVSSAGYTRYDTPEFRAAAKACGLVVTNSSDVFAEACAEHVFAFILAQTRALPRALRTRTANGTSEWFALRGAAPILRGQRAVILGYGTIAERLVEMLAPFDMEITALRREPRGGESVPVITPAQLPTALAAADHVISILPDNAASRHFINAERLAAMKPGAVFYNIGRGTTVDQSALAAALRAGTVAAAWLDVTDPEPLPEDHPLLGLVNCHITPHTAGGHRDEAHTLVRHFLANLRHYLAHEPLRNGVM